MFNFLRKFRLKSPLPGADKGVGSKYLKYAIGEIFLVVVGILIALQINNANEARKQRAEESKLLQSIKVDFEMTKRALEQLNVRRTESLQNFANLIEVRNSGDFSNEVRIDTLLAKSMFSPTYNGTTSSIAVVINSGKINLLSSDSLRAMLLAWPIQIENLIEREVEAAEITNNIWMPLAESYTSFNDWFKNYDFPEAPAKNRESRVKKDYKGLFSDRRFENTISKLEILYVASKGRTDRLISSAERIIESIK